MPQHDYIIDNQSGLNFRADLNDVLSAIVAQNSGTAEPATMYAYQLWADTTLGLLKIRDAANANWIIIGTLAAYRLGLAGLYSSASDPAAFAYAYFQWVDTSNPTKVLKVRDSTNSSWTTIGNVELTNFGALLLTGGTMSGAVLFSTTSHTTVPVGTTAQRPGSPTIGMVRGNSDLLAFEFYNGSAWVQGGSGGGVGVKWDSGSSIMDSDKNSIH